MHWRKLRISELISVMGDWQRGIAKLPDQTEVIVHPTEQVTIVNALSGAGMTLSFGLAEEVVAVL